MAKVDYKSLAHEIIPLVGGESNIYSAAHCATRLRLKLNDESKANKAKIEALPGVITVMQAGGQYQIVIGNSVPEVYQELTASTHLAAGGGDDSAPREKGNLLSRFIELISGIIHPVLWTLAGAGLFKALLAMATTFGWLSTVGTTYVILNAASDALFYYLPILLAVTSAKHFKANQFTAMAIAGALVYPSIVALAADTSVKFFGIPVVMANYTSSLIPIIIAVWLQSYLERFLLKSLPASIRNFSTPLITMAVMVPLMLLTVGPVVTIVSNAVSSGIQYLFGIAPWAGGLLMGGFWQVFVMFGLHWAFVPIMLNDLGTIGYTLLGGPVLPAVLAQAAAMLAVFLRTKSKSLKQVAGPAALSGFLAGVTEPGIYGVNLPKKTPFIYGCIGGAVGGMIAAIAGNANNAFVFPSLIGIPAYMAVGNFALAMIGSAVAILIGFGLTFVLGFPDKADEETTEAVITGGAGEVSSPVDGQVVPLDQVNDRVFASKAMGDGIAIRPTSGKFFSPVTGSVVMVMDSGHAIGIKSNEGVELLIHIGIDTVQLDGKGFKTLVATGDQLTAGQAIAEVDLDAVTAAGYETTTILVVTNTAALTSVTPTEATSVAAGEPVLTIEI